MQQQSHEASAEIRDVLLETYAVNDAMNQLLLANLDPRAWRAQLPEAKSRGGRTIGAILARPHNSHLVWIKNSAPRLKCQAPVDLDRVTPPTKKVRRSVSACLPMLYPPSRSAR